MNNLIKTIHNFSEMFDSLVQNENNNNLSFFDKNPPLTNIIERDDSYQIEIVAPGYDKENIDISIEDNKLKVEVSKEIVQDNTLLTREFGISSFSRIYRLKNDIDTENIDASHKDGILTITLQKNAIEVVKPRKIEVL